MPAQPLISILMPVYNAAETLDEAIESILRQSYPHFEFLIIDDGSTDATPRQLQRWARRDSRIRPFFRGHEGIVSALNFGLRHSAGTYLARMDADDLSHPERLEKQRGYLEQHRDTGLVSCRVEHLGDKKRKAGYARYVQWINSLESPRQISLNRFIESPLAHPSVMFRTELVQQLGGYRRGPFPEDYELWLRWLEQGVSMAKTKETLLRWRDRPQRLSRTHERYSFEAFYRIKAEYLGRWLQRRNPYHPNVVIWGAGRTSRKRAEMLTRQGITITRYIDVDVKKIGQTIQGRPVWGPNEVPPAGTCFIVSYVGLRGVNEQIQDYLAGLGYQTGRDLVFAA